MIFAASDSVPLLFAGVFLFVVLFVLFVFGSIALAVVRGAGTWLSDSAQSVRSAEARVLTKRPEVVMFRHRSSSTVYHVAFEFADGARREFRVSGPEFGVLVEGDAGLLAWQGTRYRGFRRDLAREKRPVEWRAEL